MFTKYIIIGVVVLVSIFGAYFLYAQREISKLNETNGILKSANELNVKTIDDMQESYIKSNEAIIVLQENLKTSETIISDLRDKLNKHNLQYLSLKKPGLVEKRINEATKKVFDEIELETSNK